MGVGLTVNQWTIPPFLKLAPLGPRSTLVAWAFSVGCIAWGLFTFMKWRKPIVANLNLLVVTLLFLCVSAELTLRSYPEVLGQEFANGVLTKYHTGPTGIYYHDSLVNLRFMLPDYHAEMYYNGYRWTHQTDRHGFRNSTSRETADVLFLGDSFIYGHGVDIVHTVPYLVDEVSPFSVINLARQGDAAHSQAYLLTEYIDPFRPAYVVYCFYENDIEDLYRFRTDAELQAFIATPVEDVRYAARAPMQKLVHAKLDRGGRRQSGSLLSWLRGDLLSESVYLVKIWPYLRMQARRQEVVRKARAEDYSPDDFDSLGWRYTRKAVLYMHGLAQDRKAEFIMAPILPDNPDQYQVFEELAQEHGIALIDTRILHRRNKALFLPGDGHFSEQGARVFARLIVDKLREMTESG